MRGLVHPPLDRVFATRRASALAAHLDVLRRPVAVLGLWHLVRRLHDLVLHIATKNGNRGRQRIRRRRRIGQARRDLWGKGPCTTFRVRP